MARIGKIALCSWLKSLLEFDKNQTPCHPNNAFSNCGISAAHENTLTSDHTISRHNTASGVYFTTVEHMGHRYKNDVSF